MPLLSPTQLDSLDMKRRFVLFAWKPAFVKRWLLSPFLISPLTLVFMVVTQLCHS